MAPINGLRPRGWGTCPFGAEVAARAGLARRPFQGLGGYGRGHRVPGNEITGLLTFGPLRGRTTTARAAISPPVRGEDPSDPAPTQGRGLIRVAPSWMWPDQGGAGVAACAGLACLVVGAGCAPGLRHGAEGSAAPRGGSGGIRVLSIPGNELPGY
jgi:hypothetical protein